jgi:RNA polymerase sigma-70 factor (ECF subfamily)
MEMNRAGAPAPATDPADLVARILSGDTDAEAQLVDRYSRGVGIIVSRMVADAFAADDIRQETFRLVLVKARRGEVREPERLSGFICGVARNLALAHLRGARTTEPLREIEDRRPDPLDRLLESERVRAVRQVLDELRTPRDQEILRRFYLEEEAKESICAGLGLSSLHFNRVLHRARERFRELYERQRGIIRGLRTHSESDEPR